MRLDDMPIFAMLRGRLGWLNERQKVIAQNVANADTAGYTPQDLAAPRSFAEVVRSQGGGVGGGVPLARTQATHLGGQTPQRTVSIRTERAPDSETTLDGNSVVLEEQMLKMAESRMAYDAAIGFYQKSLNLIRMAAKPPGR